MNYRFRVCAAVASGWLLCLAAWPLQIHAQEAADQAAGKLSSKFVPDDAIAAAFLSPSQMLGAPEWELAPIEVIQAAGMQYVGVDPLTIDQVKVVAGMPGPAGPQAGAVIEFSADVSIDQLNPELLAQFESKQQQGITVYESRRPPLVQLHQVDARTILVAGGGYLNAMLNANSEGTGQVPSLVSRISRRNGLTIVVGMEQIRPLVTGLLRSNANQLPPPLQGLTEVGELTDALFANIDYSPLNGNITVSAIGRDDASATKLEQTLNQSIDFGRMLALTELQKNVEGGDQVQLAMGRYLDRFSGQIAEMMRPSRNGKVVNVKLSGNVGTTGVLVGLLLPAVQSAREAARRMTASNGLKQIGLAMHNHHSAFKKLPDRAIRDASGKPLLSWRVAILPFIEAQNLHSEFHLDEPWDSDHNIRLLDRMPQVYVDPSVPTAPGHTVFQLPQGTGLMFEETGERKFRDVLDGLSNTIMAIESSSEAAVPWTKPQDLELDLADPLADTGSSHPGGFHVLMGDGAVKFISNNIDLDMFRALLTRAGKEVVGGL